MLLWNKGKSLTPIKVIEPIPFEGLWAAYYKGDLEWIVR
jgi:hypothetical protein